METLALIFTAVSCSAGATWVIHSALSKLDKSLSEHIAEDKTIHAKVIQLEAQAKKRGRTR